jgi:hypothetical protein
MFLTAKDLFMLTGYTRHSSQREWLNRNGWKFETDRNGAPIVLCAQAEQRMGGNIKTGSPAPIPRFDRIRNAG